MNKEEFINEVKKINITLNEEQIKKLDEYYNLLIEWNNKINLTRITKKEDVYLKHYYDSLTLIKGIDLTQNLKICDVGTGAGFPGIVLKIVFPNLDVTLVETLQKRCKYLEVIIDKLKLDKIKVIESRAEEYFKNNREQYDLITSRAVAKLNILSEICIPGVKINGYFIPMKANIDEEIKNIDYLKKLGSKLERIETFNLPIEQSIRNLLIIKKTEKTNEIYPRKYDKIIKMSL